MRHRSIPDIPFANLNRREMLIGLACCLSASTRSSPDASAMPTASGNDPAWTAAQPSFRIAGNIHSVGSRELASYLITTPQGHILIDSNLKTSPPQIQASVEKLGFKFSDVKILLISHAHFDHCAGSAEILTQTGAKYMVPQYMVMDADVADVESGGKTNFFYATHKSMWYPPARVDRVLHDGEPVRLGGTTLTAHKTAGHTKGCTTWTLPVSEDGKTLQAVIVGSPNVLPGYNLIDQRTYPTMAADFESQFRTLESLPCDIFLGAHASYFNMLEKYDRLKAGDKNAFVDPEGYRRYVSRTKAAFESELRKQQAKKRS